MRALLPERCRRRLLLASGCVVLMVAPASAAASTVTIRAANEYADEVYYEAAAGEANRLSISVVTDDESGDSVVTLTDPGATIAPNAPCIALDEHTVQCSRRRRDIDRGLSRVRAELGDLGDTVAPGSPANRGEFSVNGGSDDDVLTSGGGDNSLLEGGAGNDELRGGGGVGSTLSGGDGDDLILGGESTAVLQGGPGNDRLIGGASSERLDGGGGTDELYGNGGWDTLWDGDRTGALGDAGPGPDVLDGGGQIYDQITYADRRAPVFVDLADPAGDGERGEGDKLLGFVDVTGGSADDQLAGDDGGNRISGGPGRDRLVGRGGRDELTPGSGSGARISCGKSLDTVVDTKSDDLLDRDCELVHQTRVDSENALPAYPTITRRVARHRLGCPDDLHDDATHAYVRCSSAIRVREEAGRQRLLAIGRLPLGRRKARMIDLRVTPLGRRLIRRRTPTLARMWLTVTEHDGPRERYTSGARWVIKFGMTR